MIGRTLSHYTVEEKLGQGGMGVVYRARDVRLDRTVAIKVLSSHLTADDAAKERFLREARTASALDHPNILTVHEVDETPEGELFIVTAYYEGRTLRQRLGEGPLGINEVLRIARQIAAGLGAAHRKGILHRDIKPENIVLTDDGQVKILDFGLAKLADQTRVTRAGTTVGTVAYMSPEQATAGEIDHRTDIFSFGIVLYELLAGRAPFGAGEDAAVLYAVAHREPDSPSRYRDGLPVALERIVMKSLEKDPARRYQTAHEMQEELDRFHLEPDVSARPGRPRIRPWVYVAVVALVSVAVALVPRIVRRTETADVATPPAQQKPIQQITLRQVTFSSGVEEYPAFSPDEVRFVFCAEVGGFRQLFVGSQDSGETEQITEADADNIQPAWSPDGAVILFVRSSTPEGKLQPGDIFGMHSGGDIWMYDVASRRETRLIEDAFNPSLSSDGTRMAFDASWSGSRRIWMADELGRNPVQMSSDDSELVAHIVPRWSPDGTKLVFQNIGSTNVDISVLDIESRRIVTVTNDQFKDLNPVWAVDGTEVFFSTDRGGGLNVWRIPVDASGGPTGPPAQVTTGAGQDVQLAMSPSGTRIALSILHLNADLWRLPISPSTLDPTGEPEPLVTTTREDSRGRWSPDGTRIAFNSDRDGDMNIWVTSTVDGSMKQVTDGPGGDYQPTWSPDGRSLVFFSSRSGNPDIWIVDLTTGALRQLTDTPSIDINPFFSPDGRHIAFQSDREGRNETWLVNADGSNPHALTRRGVTGHFLLWRPDKASVIFKSPGASGYHIFEVPREGGEPQAFPLVAGGSHMSLTPSGDHIIDVSGHKTLWATPLAGGEPRIIFEFRDPAVRIDYPVVSPDGHWVLFDRVRPEGGDIWIVEFRSQVP